jgi:HD-GYP domain-containing protein (c-di-GMP phosphodiesterase class II)
MNDELAQLKRENLKLKKEIEKMAREAEEALKLAQALPAERDIERLLDIILSSARNITHSNAGSLYVVRGKKCGKMQPYFPGHENRCELCFNRVQNDLIPVPTERSHSLPIDKSTIVGCAAGRGEVITVDDAYRLPEGSLFHFNKSFDDNWGYRTVSILAVPLKNHRGEIFGVIELINKLRKARVKNLKELCSAASPYTERDRERTMALAGQAAVALENAILYQENRELFESFVRASVTAIESRDPTTAGHSHRVARLAVGLAQVVNAAKSGPYRDVFFTPRELMELEYAALLHDFGKVGVREEVLVKGRKLYDPQLQLIITRFLLIRKTLESEFTEKSLELLLKRSRKKYMEAFPSWKNELEERIKEIDETLKAVLLMNEPSVTPQINVIGQKLAQLGLRKYRLDDKEVPLLAPEEISSLSVLRGTLTNEERLEIESHVIHSFRYLDAIAWSRDFQNIPEIAYAHHEKLDGTGYPRGLKGNRIPLQSRIITIADIYDALTGWDRPYKKAISTAKALDILEAESREGKVDPALLELFVKARVNKRANAISEPS